MDFSFLDDWVDKEEESPQLAGDGYRHIWVVAQSVEGMPVPASLEAMGQARDLADQLGVHVYAVLIGHHVAAAAEALIGHGADWVLVADDASLSTYQPGPYAALLAHTVEDRRPEIILFSATSLGNDLAPRLAQRLGTGLISHCTRVELDMAERLLVGTCPVLGGEMTHTLACPVSRPQIATLEPGHFRTPYHDSYRSGDIQHLELVNLDLEPELTWSELDTALELPTVGLLEASVVVGVGRGIGDLDGLALAARLAEALGGVVAGSRGAYDEGWITEDQIVGVGGHTLAPDLYIACGISGDIYHSFGVRDTKFIVAINTDESAPITRIANLVAVGDAKKIISAMLDAVAG